MIIWGRKTEPGQMSKLHLPVMDGDGIEVVVVNGKREGKTLVITSGVHGCEYVGIESVRRLMEMIDPDELSGNLIFLPLINPNGFYQGRKQIMPEDGKNLNRVFPGNENGTYSEKVAHAIETHIYPHADFLLDLHGADVNEFMYPLAFYPIAGEESVNARALEAAKSLSVPCLVSSTARNGLYSWAVQKGIPALLVERGSAGLWTEQEVEACMEDMFRVMSHLGICKRRYEQVKQELIQEAVYEEADSGGFWYPEIEAGQQISKGDLLGTLKNPKSQSEKRIYAKFDGCVLYYTAALGVQCGDSLVAYGRE